MTQANTISNFIPTQFPRYFREEASTLLQFVKYYYEWLEQYENPVYVARKLKEYGDVDTIPDKYFDFMKREFMANIPSNVLVDKRLLIKNITDFYRAKGTEKAYRLLFRILYGDDDITFYYPGRDILRASDGRWVIERSLKLNLATDEAAINNLVSFRGDTSGATARKERFLNYIESGSSTYELFYTNLFGTFVVNEGIVDAATNTIVGYIKTGGLTTYDGKYIGTNGFLSWDKYLQDNYYYQEFSYQLNTSRSVTEYQAVAYNLVHPAGTKLFGSVVMNPVLDLSDILDLEIVTQAGTGESTVSILYQFVMSGMQSLEDVDIDITEDAGGVSGNSPVIVTNKSLIKDWLNFQPFSNGFGDVLLSAMNTPSWLECVAANTSSFTFSDYTPIRIDDTTNAANTFLWATKVVNTSLLVLSSEYPFGETTNLSYKYFSIP